MKIIAQRGGGTLLLIVGDDKLGQVFDRVTNRLFPKQEPAAILKFGYWQDYDGDDDADALVNGAERVVA